MNRKPRRRVFKIISPFVTKWAAFNHTPEEDGLKRGGAVNGTHFQTLKLDWPCRQSKANPSLLRFPANGEKTKEFRVF
jgi:rubredoxin